MISYKNYYHKEPTKPTIGGLYQLNELYPTQEQSSGIYKQTARLNQVIQNDQKQWIYVLGKSSLVERRSFNNNESFLVVDTLDHRSGGVDVLDSVYLFCDVIIMYEEKFWGARSEALTLVHENNK